MQKDAPTEDLLSFTLLAPDVRQLLAHHGVQVNVTLSDAQGQPLPGAKVQSLLGEVAAVVARGEHVRRLATVASLAAGVSHEARNLLTGVLGFAQVLLAKTPAGESRDMLRAIDGEARRCVDILANYLKLSRSGIETTRFVAVSEIVLPIERMVGYQLRQRGCSLAINLADDLPRVLGSCSELQRVLINLIFNASDATGTGGRILIHASCPDGQTIQISVTDDGPGVPPELREKIFEPFFSTKPANDGTGLGLALSRAIVQGHRGELVLECDGRPGTTFSVRLPVTPEPAKKR